MKPTGSPNPALSSRPGLGSVRPGEILSLRAFGYRMGLGNKSLAEAQRRGLKTVVFGRTKYVLNGADFFEKLAEKQTENPNP